MKINSVIFVSLLLSLAFSLKLQIIEEDYVKIYVGNPPEEKKFLIDPMAPYSYLLKDTKNSLSKVKFGNAVLNNVFGEFKGTWETDYFYLTEDKSFNLKLRYLNIYETNSVIKADGVLGLGFSDMYEDSNIYNVLKKMKHIIYGTRAVMSYDKKNKVLTIGEFPGPQFTNPHKFKLQYDVGSTYGSLVNLSRIGLTFADERKNKNTSYIEIGDNAMFGLIPVIIAPANRVDFLNKNYLPHIIDPSSTVNENSDKNKFFSDVFISKKTSKDLTTELLFDNIAYKYDYTRKNKDRLKSTIKYGDQPKNLMHHWYVGLDLIFVDRADFNYEEGYVKLYSAFAHDITKVKLMLLLYFAIFSVIICIILGCWLRCCCQTTSSKDYKKGEQLLDL